MLNHFCAILVENVINHGDDMKLTHTNQWRVYYVWPALFPVSNGGKSIKAGIDGNVSVKCIFIFFNKKLI